MQTSRLNSILAAVLIVFGAGAAHAQDTCESIFGPSPSAKLLELVALSKAKAQDRGLTDAQVSEALLKESRAILFGMQVRGGSLRTPDGSELDVISYEGPSALNRYAAKIHKAYGARIVSYPSKLIEMGADAAMLRIDFGEGLQPTLILGPSSLARIAEGKDPMRDPLLLHELRHIKTERELEAKKPSALYGFVRARQGMIPSSSKVKSTSYSKFMSFDEVKTFHQQAKQNLLELRRALRTKTRIVEAANDATASMMNGFTVAARAKEVSSILLETKLKPKFDLDGENVVAKIEVKLDDSQLEIEIPLVKSKGLSDPSNAKLLKDQISALQAVAQTATSQFMKAGQKLMTGEISVSLLDELQSSMNVATLKALNE